MKTGVYIGRFRPLHSAHLQTIKTAISATEQTVILIGSSFSSRTVKNPFTFDEISIMIRSCLTEDENKRLFIEPIIDHLYDDSKWMFQVQRIMGKYANDEEITLFGNKKDSSSFYLDFFPQWNFSNIENVTNLNATDIRDLYFNKVPVDEIDGNWMTIQTMVPAPVFSFLKTFSHSEKYDTLVEEYMFLKDMNVKWSKAPYKPMFVATDAIVEVSGHILLVKRDKAPGKGLWALPGGFLQDDSSIVDSMIYSLDHKTKIRMSKKFLIGNVKEKTVFDHPKRSLRGRIISNAFHIKLPYGNLPEVNKHSQWFSLAELSKMGELIFEDHLDIISHFTGIVKERP